MINWESILIFLGCFAAIQAICSQFIFNNIFGKDIKTLPFKYRIIIGIFIAIVAVTIFTLATKKEEKKSPPPVSMGIKEEPDKSAKSPEPKKVGQRKDEKPRTADGIDQPDRFLRDIGRDKGLQVAAKGIQETFDNLSFAIADKDWTKVDGFFHNDFKAKGAKGYLSKKDWIAMLKDSGEITFEFREIIRDEGANSKVVKIETMKQGKSFQEIYRVTKTGNSWQVIDIQ